MTALLDALSMVMSAVATAVVLGTIAFALYVLVQYLWVLVTDLLDRKR